MALINFGKQEIENLKNENERLSDELADLKKIYDNLNEQVEMKDIELIKAKNYIKKMKRLMKNIKGFYLKIEIKILFSITLNVVQRQQ